MGHELKIILGASAFLMACGPTAKPTPDLNPTAGGVCQIEVQHPDGAAAVAKIERPSPTKRVETWVRSTADGTTTTEIVEEALKDGVVITIAKSVDGNATENITLTYQGGELVKKERDYLNSGVPGVDGEVDEVSTYQKSDNELVESIDRAGPNAGVDGQADITVRSVLNDGRVSEQIRSHGEREVERLVFGYGDGRLETKKLMVPGIDEPEAVTTYSYDDQNRVKTETETSPLGETKTAYTYCD